MAGRVQPNDFIDPLLFLPWRSRCEEVVKLQPQCCVKIPGKNRMNLCRTKTLFVLQLMFIVLCGLVLDSYSLRLTNLNHREVFLDKLFDHMTHSNLDMFVPFASSFRESWTICSTSSSTRGKKSHEGRAPEATPDVAKPAETTQLQRLWSWSGDLIALDIFKYVDFTNNKWGSCV